MKPPYFFANLDLGSDGGPITLEQAEAINCTGPISPADDAGNPPYMAWGGNGEVQFFFDEKTHVLSHLTLMGPGAAGGGYTKPLQFKSRDTLHTHVMQATKAVTKDGNPFPIDWTDNGTAQPALTELTDALTATFGPQFPATANCVAERTCLDTPDDSAGHSLFGARVVDLYVELTPGTNVPVGFDTFGFYRVPSDGGTDAATD